MPLIKYNEMPPGGYPYVQAETGMKFPAMIPFRNQAKAIMAHRQANKLQRSSLEECEEDLDLYTCQRIGNDPRYCIDRSVKKNFLPKAEPSPQHFLRRVAERAAEGTSKLANGVRVLSDWVGDGMKPVSLEKAEARASVCKGCRYNELGHGAAMLTERAAQYIHEQMNHKAGENLAVSDEDKLGTCDVCYCNLPLKVWVPWKTISDRTPKKMMEKFPDHCWIKTEKPEPTNPLR